MRRVDPHWEEGLPASGGASELDKPLHEHGGVGTGWDSCLRIAVLFLLVGLVSLSTLAKTSRCLPQSNPARYLSHLIKMRETSGQRLGERQIVNKGGADKYQKATSEEAASPLLRSERPFPKLPTVLNAHSLRSPPADFS